MKVPEESQGIGASLLPILEKLPVLSRYARTRGWYYVICWLQRVTGIGLFIALMVHIYTLSSWQTPSVYHTGMNIPARPFFVFLAWILSLFVSFHALNGGRLILYELFGMRNDETMIRWTFGLSAAYAAMVGLLMILKNQRASAFFFWMIAFTPFSSLAPIAAHRGTPIVAPVITTPLCFTISDPNIFVLFIVSAWQWSVDAAPETQNL